MQHVTPLVWLWAVAAALVFMTVAFAWAYRLKRIDVVDIAWGPAFIVVAGVAYAASNQTAANRVSIILVGLWGMRLYWHILQRFQAHDTQDPRYTKLTAGWPRRAFWPQVYGRIFVLQAVLVAIISLPVLVSISAAHYHRLSLAAGALVWLIGFVCEVSADRQLAHFTRDPKNHGKLLKTGLWRYSRHPNYFGELTQWWGLWLITLGDSWTLLAVVGPVVLTGLICFVSGVPLAEKRAAIKPGWQAYKQATSVLIPWVPRTINKKGSSS